MKVSKEILEELECICPLLSKQKKINVFEVPDAYFNDLAETITFNTLINLNPQSKITQQVPEGYFNTLSGNILARIKSEKIESVEDELEQLSPLLFSLKDKNVFSVPEGYFGNLNHMVSVKLNPKAAKVISISKVKAFWKYAAAAVITGAIAITSLQIFNNSPEMMKNNSVVNESSGLPDYVQTSFKYKTEAQLNQGIASLGDDEIINYLEKDGNIMDNELLTRDVDTKELPTTTDYLTNKNALNDYLNKIDVQKNNSN